MLITLLSFSQNNPLSIPNKSSVSILKLSIPLKEPCLVISTENVGDTFALVNIKRIKAVNDKIEYMYECITLKDSLNSTIDSYKSLDATKNQTIAMMKIQLAKVNSDYQSQRLLSVDADKIMKDQETKLSNKNKIITILGASTGGLLGILILVLVIH